MESGPRPAIAQPESRQRRFGARLLSLPRGNEAEMLVGGAVCQREEAGGSAWIGR